MRRHIARCLSKAAGFVVFTAKSGEFGGGYTQPSGARLGVASTKFPRLDRGHDKARCLDETTGMAARDVDQLDAFLP